MTERLITPNEIHERRWHWQNFLEKRWDDSIRGVNDNSTLISMLLGSALAACIYIDPNSFKASDINSDYDTVAIISKFFYMHPMNINVLIDCATEGMSGYDIGWAMIAMPMQPKELIDQRGFWTKLLDKIKGS